MNELAVWRGQKLDKDAAVLWLNGPPGIGKSTAAGFIIDVLQGSYPDAIILYFFNKHSNLNLAHLSNIIKTFAYQLSQTVPAVRERLERVQKEGFYPNKVDNIQQLFHVLLLEVWPLVMKEVFIIIDGLDECNSSPGCDLKEFLSLVMSLRKIRVLVISRRVPEIAAALSNFSKEVGQRENSADISLFISHRVASSMKLSKGFMAAGLDPVKFLQARAKGNFLWLTLVLSVAEKAELMKKFRDAFHELPAGFHRVYELILDQVQTLGHHEWVKEVLTWIIGSERSLNISELQTAVETSLGDTFISFQEFLQTHAGSLLQISADSLGLSTPQLIHDSLHDFLADPASGCKPEFLIDAWTTQGHLTEICLQYINKTFGVAGFAKYASLNWMEHFNRCPDDGFDTRNLIKLLYYFCNGKGIENWIQAEIMINREQFSAHFVHRIVKRLWHWLKRQEVVSLTLDPADTRFDEWKSKVASSGLGCLHESIGYAVGRICFSSRFKEPAEVDAAFRVARTCVMVAAKSKEDPEFQWESWYEKKKYGWAAEEAVSAEEILSIGLQLGYDKSYAQCCANISFILAMHGLFEDAIEHLAIADEMDPGFGQYVWWLGSILEADRKSSLKKVLQCYELAMVKSPVLPDSDRAKHCWRLRAKLHVESHNYDSAIGVFRETMLIDAQYFKEDFEKFARHCLQERRLDLSIEAFKTLLEYDAIECTWWMELGMAYLAAENLVEAEECCRKAQDLATTPHSMIRARYLLGEVCASQAKYDNALLEYNAAISTESWDKADDLYGEILYDLAIISDRIGDTAGAEGHYARAVRTLVEKLKEDGDGSNWPCRLRHHLLGLVYGGLGKLNEARTELSLASRGLGAAGRDVEYTKEIAHDLDTLAGGGSRGSREAEVWIRRKKRFRSMVLYYEVRASK